MPLLTSMMPLSLIEPDDADVGRASHSVAPLLRLDGGSIRS
jgi:hypothetical protein